MTGSTQVGVLIRSKYQLFTVMKSRQILHTTLSFEPSEMRFVWQGIFKGLLHVWLLHLVQRWTPFPQPLPISIEQIRERRERECHESQKGISPPISKATVQIVCAQW